MWRIAQRASVPAGLPTHFSFGLMSAPGTSGGMNDMRTRNGTKWDFRYQYLSAGVNTGNGWATWNSPAGQFATYYMNDSAANGYIPAFVYYMLLQSNGPGGNGEGGTNLAHLNSPSTMSAYYADWTLLMQKVGAFKKTALIVVEPDLWGFMEQSVTHGVELGGEHPGERGQLRRRRREGVPEQRAGIRLGAAAHPRQVRAERRPGAALLGLGLAD